MRSGSRGYSSGCSVVLVSCTCSRGGCWLIVPAFVVVFCEVWSGTPSSRGVAAFLGLICALLPLRFSPFLLSSVVVPAQVVPHCIYSKHLAGRACGLSASCEVFAVARPPVTLVVCVASLGASGMSLYLSSYVSSCLSSRLLLCRLLSCCLFLFFLSFSGLIPRPLGRPLGPGGALHLTI